MTDSEPDENSHWPSRRAMRVYRRIMAQHGVRLCLTSGTPHMDWPGTGITLWVPKEGGPDLPAHELGHWFVATRAERQLPEFGLGTPYWVSREVVWGPQIDRCCFQVDALASILGIFFQLRVEGRAAGLRTWVLHEWKPGAARRYIRSLIRSHDLVWHRGKLYPRALVRPPRKRDLWGPPL